MHGNRAAKMNDLKIKFDMPTSVTEKAYLLKPAKCLPVWDVIALYCLPIIIWCPSRKRRFSDGAFIKKRTFLDRHYLVSAGVVEPVMDSFKKEGITYSMCGDVNKEPTVRLLDEIGLSARLSDFGYKEIHLQTIIKETLDSAQAPTNPREPKESELADIVNKIV